MAYGSSELDVVATTVDMWINEGQNAYDLFSKQNPFIAVLFDNSKEPGGDYQFKQRDRVAGNQFKNTAFGKGSSNVRGVSRANQVTGFTPSVTTNLDTNAIWPWAHYEGMIYNNSADMTKNAGAQQMIDLGESIKSQMIATFYDTVGTDLFDGVVGTESKIQSVNHCLLNNSAVGGIDQTDTANNDWWLAQVDSTAESFNTTTFDQVRDACVFDTSVPTGIAKIDPDIAFLYGNLYGSLRQQLKPAQRTEMDPMLKGGAKYLMYDGIRCFRSLKQTANTVMVLNSTTWVFIHETKAPDPVTPGWVPTSGKPSFFERGYNWWLGLGCLSVKHNGQLSNKTA